MRVITRFAPSPTGYLHIGSARSALFNYLFAKHYNGKFMLRIEDTDQARSIGAATDAIFSSLQWLGLNWDGEVLFQSQRMEIYKNFALELVKAGKAYYCFTSQQEIQSQRDAAIASKQPFIFHSKWRDVTSDLYPSGINPVVRLKAPRSGSTVVHDQLQGDVITNNEYMDDMVLLRSDGSATYMLAVVVDDHEMGITHIIRGDDHLTNAARQILIYNAFGWQVPTMVHIPLIHSADGAKLSKRYGAVNVEEYKKMGYLPEALSNYLLRLGWSHGDDEIISKSQAIEWFDIKGLGKSPARIDFAKMRHFNSYYLRALDDVTLTKLVIERLAEDSAISTESQEYIQKAMPSIKIRSELINDLVELAKIYIIEQRIKYSPDVKCLIQSFDQQLIINVINGLESLEIFTKDSIQEYFKTIALSSGMKIGELMKPLRLAMTGQESSPSVFEIIAILGKSHSVARLNYALSECL